MYIIHDFECDKCGARQEHFVENSKAYEEKVFRCPKCEDGMMKRILGVGLIKGGDTPKYHR